MMSFALIRKLAFACGLYHPARWVYRQVLNRRQLRNVRNDIEFYSEHINSGDLVFDVGAHIGDKVEVFLKIGAKVVAFEPQPECQKELKARWGWHTNLTILSNALGPEPSQAEFFIRSQRSASGLVEDWGGEIEESITVDVVPLDAMVARYGVPRFCKIDVEGFEHQVLKGLSQPIPMVSLEYHLTEADIKKTLDCFYHLAGFGDIRLNLMPAEELKPYFDQWLTLDEFLNEFPDTFMGKDRFFYGDVFIRSLASS